MIFAVIGDCVMAPFPHRLTLLQEGGGEGEEEKEEEEVKDKEE